MIWTHFILTTFLPSKQKRKMNHNNNEYNSNNNSPC
jgi:hypothetical protein